MSQGRKVYLGERIHTRTHTTTTQKEPDSVNVSRRHSGKNHHHHSNSNSNRRASGRSLQLKASTHSTSAKRLDVASLEIAESKKIIRHHHHASLHKEKRFYIEASETKTKSTTPYSDKEIQQFSLRLDKLREQLNSQHLHITETEKNVYLNKVAGIFSKITLKKSCNIDQEIGLLEAMFYSDEHQESLGKYAGKEALRNIWNASQAQAVPTKIAAKEFNTKTVKPSFFRRLCCHASVIEDADDREVNKKRNR